MEDLKKTANDPIWDQGYTRASYGFPLPLDRDYQEEAKALSFGVPEEQLHSLEVFFTVDSPESHIGPFKWAIDFLVKDGTEVLAARDGVVVEVVDSFSSWGPSENFRAHLNYITICHSDGDFSQYCHLEIGSAQVKLGDLVREGQVIARVGKTGWTDRDHLHFLVFRLGDLNNSGFDFYSLKVKFKGL